MQSIVLISLVVLVVVASQLRTSEAAPAPDSGGHIELPGPGIAFGGIPYGSVSGMLVNYGPAGQQQQVYYNPTSYGGGGGDLGSSLLVNSIGF
ncbi:hypothetical protein TKK_0017997 [Trichogramma kaykai]